MPGLRRFLQLLVLSASSVMFAASPRAVAPRHYVAPAFDAAQREARLSLPSRRTVLGQPSVHRIPAIEESELHAISPKSGMVLVGRHRPLDGAALSRGQWDTLPDGSNIWRLAIQSPDARGVRLHFTRFAVGSGRVWIHDGSGDESQIAGPYTGAGPFSDGDFWSNIVLADTVVIEYQPATSQIAGSPSFRIDEITHHFASPKADNARSAAASCELDVTCFSDWAETSKSVARISFESGISSFVCSGTLLNTRGGSGTPLFLTANHCIDTDTVARTLQAFWFYQTNACNAAPPSTRNLPSSLGARLLVTGDRTQGDFSLVQLNTIPSGVVFSGWDPEEVKDGAALTVIHHPAGDFKRIAFGNRQSNSRTPANFYSVFYSSGLTEGGSSGSGLFSAPNVLVGTLSNGPKADTPEQYCQIIPFADNYGKFSSYYPLLRDILEDRSISSTPPPPTSGQDLTSGTAAQFSFNAVSTGTLFNGTNSFRIAVPPGATRLDIVLATATPNADLDLFARFGQDTTVASGNVVADYTSAGATGNERITITPSSNPPLKAGTYFISMAVYAIGVPVTGTLTATVTTASTTALTPGTTLPFTIGPVTSNTLLSGARGFTVNVPEGATRLDVRLASSTPGVDLDLFVRFGTDVAASSGSAVADYSSTGDTADESISITSTSSPPLRAGTYFIGIGVFSLNVSINATITATVSATAPTGGTALTSGRAQSFTLPAGNPGTLFNGSRGYSVTVPEGATRLDIVLATSTPNVDIDLFARFGGDTSISSGSVVADFSSTGPGGNEQITITTSSNPALRAGTYFISLAMFTAGVEATGTLTATLSTDTTPPPPSGPTVLTSGIRQSYTLPSTSQPLLYNGNRSWVVDVGVNATRLDIQLVTTTPGTDVDLFVRFNSDPAVSAGSVVSDYSSTGPDGSERVTITADSSPPLRPGRYFISLAAFTTNVDIAGTLLATVTTATAVPPPGAPLLLTPGVPSKFSLPAVDSGTLYNGNYSFKIQVPDDATLMRVQLTSDNPAIDADLYVRYQSDTDVTDGSVVADYASEGNTGNEVITITSSSSPPLRPGTYFISMALFTRGVTSTGSIAATVERGPIVPPTSTAREITSGVPVTYALPAVSTPTLLTGDFSYRITVGSQHTRLAISVRNDPATVDVDLFARFGQEPAVSASGGVASDLRSASDGGNEDIVISGLNLRPGTYFISMALFTTGIQAKGTLTATLSSDGNLSAPATVSSAIDGLLIEPKRGWAVAQPLTSKTESKEQASPDGELVKESDRLKKRSPVKAVWQ